MIAPLERKYVAGMETDRADQEEAQFLYISETRHNGQANTGGKSVMLNAAASPAKVLGPAKGFKVYNGDQINMEVWAKHASTSGISETSPNQLLLTALSAAFGVSSGSTGEGLQIYNGLNAAIGANILLNQSPGNTPAAYLNYLFFDNNYVYQSGGFTQVNSTSYAKLTNSFTANKDGYLFVYLSNESTLNANVYFDDLIITHTSNDAVLQADDYYPFGMSMNNSFLEAGISPNRFLYQGKEWQTELGLNLYDFHARQFDPSLGRFLSVDAASQFNSPYLGMGNAPIMTVDPDGNFAFVALGAAILKGAIIGAGISAATYTASIALSNGGFQNWDWNQFGKSAGRGAISGGIGEAFGGVGGIYESTDAAGNVSQIAKPLGGSSVLHEAARAGAHSLSGGGINALSGGNFWQGAAAGALGSATGSLFHNSSPGLQIGSSALSGGVASRLTGGKFWTGAAQGGIIAAANHVYHRHLKKGGPPWEYNGKVYDNKTDLYLAILVDMAADQFGIKDIVALTGVISGQPILEKRFRTPGSSRGTSPASKFFTKVIPNKSPVRLPTLVGTPKVLGGKGMRVAFTKVIGRFVGRAIPIIGWGVLGYDVVATFYRTHVTYHGILNK